MKFLIDNMLSVRLVDELSILGNETVHVRSRGLGAAPDAMLLELAKSEERVIISGDRDFSTLLAELRFDQPSVIYLRSGIPLAPKALADLIHANLPSIQNDLAQGSIVIFEPGRIRVRRLPIC